MDKKITIGLFLDSFFPMTDGVIMVVDNYARRLVKYANVIVFAPKYRKKYDDSKLPYQVIRCNSFEPAFFDYLLPVPKLDMKFYKKLNSCNLDIVHIHSPFTLGKVGVKYAKERNIPCIGTMHSQFKQDFKRIVKSEYIASYLVEGLMDVFNNCDECYAVNQEVARIFHEEYHYKKLPRVLNNATEMLPVKEEKHAYNYIDKKYNLTPDVKVFLFVGRINVLKNVLFIVDALKILKEERPDLKFKMFYVGMGQDEDVLKEHIKQLNLNNDIILCGKIINRKILSYYYKRADLFLFPSVYDASSIVQIEAACQKTPGIFLKNTATASTIIDNVNGFLSDNDFYSYASKIIEVLDNKELYDKVKENAYKDLYKYWDDEINNVYKIYIDLINKKRKNKYKGKSFSFLLFYKCDKLVIVKEEYYV